MEADVLQAFGLRSAGWACSRIAKYMRVSEAQVYNILKRKHWGWVSIPEDVLAKVRETKKKKAEGVEGEAAGGE